MLACDACGFDVPPFTGQHTADDVLCADCLAKAKGIARAEAGDADAVGVARSDVGGVQAVSPAPNP